MDGRTVLYVPPEDLSDISSATISREICQRLESLVIHWTRQIKDVVSQHTSESLENSGPLEEIDFWNSRCSDLSGLSKQLTRPEVLQIITALDAAKSSYLEQFTRLSNLIQDHTVQAVDNLKYLSLLRDPCNELSRADACQVLEIVPKILTAARFIWSHSKFYNTKEKLTGLLRKVSNEIIRRCSHKISLEDIFHGDVNASVLCLMDSIQCGEGWKSKYKETATHISKFSELPWDLDSSSIFAQVDAFVQRCRDLLEVCEGQMQFARKLNGRDSIPIPPFGGTHGPEVTKGFQDIQLAFQKQVDNLWTVKDQILDVKATGWHDDYNSFKQGIKDLEVMMQNTIVSAFEGVSSIEPSIELLETFHHLARKDAIKRTIEKKANDVYLMFLSELSGVKTEFELHKKEPRIYRLHADFAGSGVWAKSLLKKIQSTMQVLSASYYLPRSSLFDEIKIQYEITSSAIEDYINKNHSEWVAAVPANLAQRLENTLLSRQSDNCLDMKFDWELLRLMGEVTVWQKLKHDAPFHVQELLAKKEELRVLREHVLLVVRDYNSIVNSLSQEEHHLFKERMRFLDRKVNPGLSTLTWSSKGIADYFVKDCLRHSHDVQRVVQDFGESNSKVHRNCKLIAETLLWRIESKHVYDLDEFERDQLQHTILAKARLKAAHDDICQTLNQAFEGFKNDGKEVQQQWSAYIEKIDIWVEDALRTSVRRSLLELARALNGDPKGRDGPGDVPPLFKVNVVLEQQKVDFSPNFATLEETVNKVAREMVSCISIIPRLASNHQGLAKVYDSVANEDETLKIFVSIQNGMAANATQCQSYLRNWDTYREIWEINKDAFIRRYAKLKPTLSTFDADISRYNEVANNTQKEETLTNINFIRLDCSPLKHALVSHCMAWQAKLTGLLNGSACSELRALHEMFERHTSKLKIAPKNLDALSESVNLLEQIQNDMKSVEAQFAPISEQYQILEKYEVQIKEEEKALLQGLRLAWEAFVQTVNTADVMLQDCKSKFKNELINSVDEFSKLVASIKEDFAAKGPYSYSNGISKAMQTIQDFKSQIQELAAKERSLRKGLAVFKIDHVASKDIESIGNELELLQQIWQIAKDWEGSWSSWKCTSIQTLDHNELTDTIQKFQKKLARFSRESGAKEWDVLVSLKENCVVTQKLLPVILDLKNPAMRPRHWSQLSDQIGKSLAPSPTELSLEKITEAGLDQYSEAIAQLSNGASRELAIENDLTSVKEVWETLEFDLVAKADDKQMYKIRSTDSIFEVLEDNQVILSSMKSSKYFVAFEQEVQFWEGLLSKIVETTELLLQVQKQWTYLESIFVGSEDIRKQLPGESATFDAVNTSWKSIVTGIRVDKNVLRTCQQEDLIAILEALALKLDGIQKSLESYLETKRQAFPRFYFLSNDDLLEILGQGRDPNTVQAHLKKCFDNLVKLELSQSQDTHHQFEAQGMHSADGEYVPYQRNVLLEGPVEGWLLEVERNMRASLKESLSNCLSNSKKVKRDKWLKEWPGQMLITVSLINWTADCVRALFEVEGGELKALKTLKKANVSSLKRLVDMVKAPLTSVERKKLTALITIEVHSRDVIEKLHKSNCTNPLAFEWLSQMSPQGPAGTGKTETVKDLGKALGYYVIVQNCSEGLDYKSMGRMFSGLAQTGAWGCFDEFNRIDIEVLSVVALQINCVLKAISHNLFRPVSMMVPDSVLIAENMLFAQGFSNCKILAKKVESLFRLSQQQLSKQDHYDFGLRGLTATLRTAGSNRWKEALLSDEVVVFWSLRDMNIPKLTARDVPLFMAILGDLFPGVEYGGSAHEELQQTIKQHMTISNLQILDTQITKIIQLFETKLMRHGVMIVGPTGSGKSVVWNTLQAALQTLAKLQPGVFQGVKSFAINAKSLSLAELFGEFNLSTSEWTDGVLSSVMRTACTDEKQELKWILLDGPVDTLWIESMNSVLDDNKVLTLINGERITLPAQVSLLFEVESLSAASPATVSRCGMIYLDSQDLGWRPYVASWLKQHDDKTVTEVLEILTEKYIQHTLQFCHSVTDEPILVTDLRGVQSLCSLFDALATIDNGVDPTDKESCTKMIELWFLFSLIWAFGGPLSPSNRRKFDMFVRETEGQFPSKDTIFEYAVDKKSKSWVPWEEKIASNWRYNPLFPFHKVFIPTIDTVRNSFVAKALIDKNKQFLLVGEVGSGKTSLMQSVLASSGDNNRILSLSLSSNTSSSYFQSIIEGQLEKRTKNIFTPTGGKQLVVFIDDLSMPAKDLFGTQSPLELLRHWMDYGFWYDRAKQSTKFVNDLLPVACMGLPGGGRNNISSRLQSRFFLLNIVPPNEISLSRIFGTMINQKLQDFEETVKPLGAVMTTAAIELYHTIIAHFLPTPAKSHYTFNLRDMSRVFQGLLRANRDYYDSKISLTKLWVHEIMRVFGDRLTDQSDKDHLSLKLEEKLIQQFNVTLKELCGDTGLPLFGDYLSAESGNVVYEEISNKPKHKTFMEIKLQDYNMEPGYVQLDLVLFQDAIEHISRITRVLRLQAGNMLLLGVGGSGRQSLCHLAAYLLGMQTFQIKITKHYQITDFREDIKGLYKTTGVDSHPVVFLVTESQITQDSFLEDLSNILCSGQIPNLFSTEDLPELKQAFLATRKDTKASDASTASWFDQFIDRARSNLHIALCMSPFGEDFRSRLRKFPSLANCCTIDYFGPWPREALLEVASKYLDGTDFGSNSLRASVVQVFGTIHTSVAVTSAKMQQEIKRQNYVTPTNYLELVAGYGQLLKQQKSDLGQSCLRLRNGLEKLDETQVNVKSMSADLEVARKQVAQYQKQCEDYLVVIVQQKRDADEQAKQVLARTEKLMMEEEEVRAVAQAAQADLDLAMPALNAALVALEAINKKDLQEIKSYGKPPPLVEKVLEAVMILKKSEPTWDEAKRQLGNPYFIKQLVNFEKDNISDKILKKISTYCAEESFNPEVVGKVSGAAKSLCLWVRAMESYGQISRQVAPKREKLRSAQEVLEKKQKSLGEAKEKLQEVQNKLAELQALYDEKVGLKEKLRVESEVMALKLNRAENLLSGLSGEKQRWEQTIGIYEMQIEHLVGDSLLASAFLSYAGPFSGTYREQLLQSVWIPQMKAAEIQFTSDFRVEKLLVKPTEIQDWIVQGLPADQFSVENAVIVTRGRRWPLMIDPQGQATNWIRKMGASLGIKVIDTRQSDFMRTLESSIQFGVPVLIQGLSEQIDPSLSPIMNKAITKQGSRLVIKLGEKEIEYNPEFQLYLTTPLSNPSYSPETYAKAAVVNFAVSEQGLEDQLLGIVLKKERPDLEEQKTKLVSSVAAAKHKLEQLEDQILHLLSTAQGSLLDDEKLVDRLQTSKTTSDEVSKQLHVSEETAKTIDVARDAYRVCAQRSSILYFVLLDMASIDNMYQFSIEWYVTMFEKSIAKSQKSEDILERLKYLNSYHTYAIYRNASRSLFQIHRFLFSFQLTIKILETAGKLDRAEYDFLLIGGQVLDRESQPTNSCKDWLPEPAWDNITELDKLPSFVSLASSFDQNEREWRAWYNSSDPENSSLPAEWEGKLSDAQKMLVVRSLRPDRVIFCARKFVAANIGSEFAESPALNFDEVLADSDCYTPLIFVLSPGVDPTATLQQLAERHGKGPKFHFTSLGQGQAPKAAQMIEQGARDGNWVFLANCHLSISWMPALEKTITTEPPQGLKSNILRLFSDLQDNEFAASTQEKVYAKLYCSLVYFHSLLLERKKFQTLGWNVPYSFTDSDFEVSKDLLLNFLNEYKEVPWDALRYLISEANYGGRVTDEWDRRVLRAYINTLFSEEALGQEHFQFSSIPSYCVPDGVIVPNLREYMRSLPDYDHPEVFGEHSNADISTQIKQTDVFLNCLVSLRPQNAKVEKQSREEIICGLAQELCKHVPMRLETSTLLAKMEEMSVEPLNVPLFQEVQQYNILLQKVSESLGDIQKGLKGLALMSNQTEECAQALEIGKVPPLWSKGIPVIKPLAAWMRDLAARVEFFDQWLKSGEPKTFWLGAFTFPTGFLTAVLQRASRSSGVPVDGLVWDFSFPSTDDENQPDQNDGVYVHSIILEGAM
ncbi:Dynein heavy chain 2, axonemal [Gonapodya sp. JEL0774]|nr:Dynein heavy chain 2, axonemal [Gonapodya sp. JEL0774]